MSLERYDFACHIYFDNKYQTELKVWRFLDVSLEGAFGRLKEEIFSFWWWNKRYVEGFRIISATENFRLLDLIECEEKGKLVISQENPNSAESAGIFEDIKPKYQPQTKNGRNLEKWKRKQIRRKLIILSNKLSPKPPKSNE